MTEKVSANSHQPLRAGIVGCSGIAIAKPERSAAPRRTPLPHSHAAAFHAVPSTVVAAVCDVVPASTERYKTLWGEVPTYSDYREMLAREHLDLLSIVTPDHLHADIFVDACAAGVKGIFCEKPIATTLGDADRMIAAAAKYGVKVVVNHTRRFDPFYRQAKWLIDQGTIGKLSRVIGTMGGERAMLFRNGTHLADTIAYFADSDPDWLIAELDDEGKQWGTAYMGTGGRDASSEPGATAYIRFKNGVRAVYNGTKTTTTNFELDLQGESGRIRISDQFAELSLPVEGGGLTTQSLPASIVMTSGMVAAVEELVESLAESGDGVKALQAGRTTLEILLGILVSADAGAARVDFPLVEGASAGM
jgi:UDP-N-acetyl-2-amino-2-deoxyglucuronate dehydrogenase